MYSFEVDCSEMSKAELIAKTLADIDYGIKLCQEQKADIDEHLAETSDEEIRRLENMMISIVEEKRYNDRLMKRLMSNEMVLREKMNIVNEKIGEAYDKYEATEILTFMTSF